MIPDKRMDDRSAMTHDELRQLLDALKLTRAEFAKLVGVSKRTVDNWLIGERNVPGPVHKYLELFSRLPREVQAREIARTRDEDDELSNYQGIYSIRLNPSPYSTRDLEERIRGGALSSRPAGILVFLDGQVFGIDWDGVSYDGSYECKEDHLDIDLEVTVPRGVTLRAMSAGPLWEKIPSGPLWEAKFDMKIALPPEKTVTRKGVETPYGPIDAHLTYLRGFPADWKVRGAAGGKLRPVPEEDGRNSRRRVQSESTKGSVEKASEPKNPSKDAFDQVFAKRFGIKPQKRKTEK
jgi:transcriptional regulator with XRE-family HTH domain